MGAPQYGSDPGCKGMRSIDDVLQRLDEIVAHSVRTGSRLGYFAALYRHMTRHVQLGVQSGRFEDGPRMEALDVHFAGRYFAAYDEWQAGTRPTEAWQVGFAAATAGNLIVLQDLLLGMNAHINLDLGIAAAQVCPGSELAGLHRDFDEINVILAELTTVVEQELDAVSPRMALLRRLVGKPGIEAFEFTMDLARASAWDLASLLAPLSPEQQVVHIARRDAETAWLGQRVARPGLLLGLLNRYVRGAEMQDVATVIQVLADRLEQRMPTVAGTNAAARVAAAQL